MILPYALALVLTPVTATISILGFIKDTEAWRKFLFLAIIVVFLMAYSYSPMNDSDLVRYFQYINQTKGLSFSQTMVMFNDGLFVKNFIFWLAGLINNTHIVPAITTSVVYAVSGYITCDFAEKLGKLKLVPYVLIIQCLALQFLSIVNNVRNVSAFAIAALAFYLDLVKRKNKFLLIFLYVLPIFIHPSAVIVLAIRIFSVVPKKALYVLMVLVFFFSEVVDVFYKSGLAVHFGQFVFSNTEKLWWYLNDPLTSEWSRRVAGSKDYIIQRWSMIGISFLFILVLVFKINELDTKMKFNKEEFSNGLILFNMTTIACYSIVTPQYWRMSTLCMIIAGPVLLVLFSTSKSLMFTFIKLCIVILSLVLLLIQMKINAYSIDFGEFMYSLLINDFYVVLVKIISGIVGLSF